MPSVLARSNRGGEPRSDPGRSRPSARQRERRGAMSARRRPRGRYPGAAFVPARPARR